MMNRQCGEPFAPAVRYALRFEHVSIREEDVVSEVYWSEQDAHAPDYRLNADFKVRFNGDELAESRMAAEIMSHVSPSPCARSSECSLAGRQLTSSS